MHRERIVKVTILTTMAQQPDHRCILERIVRPSETNRIAPAWGNPSNKLEWDHEVGLVMEHPNSSLAEK